MQGAHVRRYRPEFDATRRTYLTERTVATSGRGLGGRLNPRHHITGYTSDLQIHA